MATIKYTTYFEVQLKFTDHEFSCAWGKNSYFSRIQEKFLDLVAASGSVKAQRPFAVWSGSYVQHFYFFSSKAASEFLMFVTSLRPPTPKNKK